VQYLISVVDDETTSPGEGQDRLATETLPGGRWRLCATVPLDPPC
jgi:hypothetical protein